MSEDDTLLKYAQRIKARAIRREGELFKMIEPGTGKYQSKSGGAPTLDRKAAAAAAGISKDQMVNSIRVANIPQHEFDDAHVRLSATV